MNVYLITIDAWRASHASFNPGGIDNLTPNLERLSQSSGVFTQALSHGPATPYAFPSIFSSTLPLDHGGYESMSVDRHLISECLQEEGWRCVGVHANPWLGEKYGYGRGYEEYHDVGEFSLPFFDTFRELLIDRFGLDHPFYHYAQKLYRQFQGPLSRIAGDNEVETAIQAVTENSKPSTNTFLWVHLLTPHAPYTPPKRHREAVGITDLSRDPTQLVTQAQHKPGQLSREEQSIVCRLYGAAVRHVDEQVGRLLTAINDEESLLIVTADHGEALFEHGQLGHEPSLYDELLRVPLLIRQPNASRSGVRVDAQVRHIDIAPTILDFVDIDRPGQYRGRSLRPALEGEEIDDEIAIAEVASTPDRPGTIKPSALQICIRNPDRKLLYHNDRSIGYDLKSDPEETNTLDQLGGDGWKPLEKILTTRLDEIDFTETTSVDRDSNAEQRLKDLGYID